MNYQKISRIDFNPSIIHSTKKISSNTQDAIIIIAKPDDVPRILRDLQQLNQG